MKNLLSRLDRCSRSARDTRLSNSVRAESIPPTEPSVDVKFRWLDGIGGRSSFVVAQLKNLA